MPRRTPKPITLHDVAELSGVSYQTVSRVINNHPYVSKDTRHRVLAAIRELDYRPNRVARSLATRRSYTLGVVTFGTNYYGPSQMMANVERAARSRGYNLTVANIDTLTPRAMLDIVDQLGGQLVDGLVLITPVLGISYEELVTLCAGIPFVMIDAQLGARIPSVVIDQRYGSQLATQHLLDLGHRRIAEIRGPLNWFGAIARHESCLATLKAAGLEPVCQYEGNWTAEDGYHAAHQLLDSGATFSALVVGNDQMALGAMRALHERGIRIPDDVSLVGFDDIPEAAYFEPPLTTVRQDFGGLGEQSVEYLVSMIDDPDTPMHQRVLHPTLVVRDSTRTLE
ncbi:MAG TPA: LacI family DNA-binding transcriptional regulator [Aggregatilinea sp.]|jgi:LacI family transcriptional regulator|uniref:LacI family DNA-binding transcriptional regulator n=1 Tax=Aggregatilinea sp. TaxID=2806333 RepID=UPI002B948489|nr:LacI family DNA-binding transcriptional regulator [Aggregatilinea sp.]HML23458.1 LacI family DNA-binding transcriptional regulator [Aggregatilinea sp.]